MKSPFKADIEILNLYASRNSSPPQTPQPLEPYNEIFDERFSVFRNASSNKRTFDEPFSVLDNSSQQPLTQIKTIFRRVEFNKKISVINRVENHKLVADNGDYEAGVFIEISADSFRSSRASRRIDVEGYGNNDLSTDDKSSQLLRIAQEKHPNSLESNTNLNKEQSEPFERYFDPENLETSINTIANAYLGSPANISDDKITDFATTYADYLNEKFNTKFRENEVNEESVSSQEVPKDHHAISLRSANISDDEIKGSEKTYLEYLEEMLLRKNKEEVNEVSEKSVSSEEVDPYDSEIVTYRFEGEEIHPQFGYKNSVVQPPPVKTSSAYSYFLPSIKSPSKTSSLQDDSDNFSSSRSKPHRSTALQEVIIKKAVDTDADVLPPPLLKPEAISALPPISEPESEIISALPPISAPNSEITSESVSKTLQTSTKPNQSIKGVANINYSIKNNFLVFNIRAIKDKPLFYAENKSYLNKISSFFLRCFRDDISHDSVLEKELTKGLVKDYGFIAIAKKEDEELIKSFISELRDSKAVFANWQNQDNPKNNLYSKIYKLESGFENNRISREKIVKLLEFGLDVKHECSNNADLDKLIEAIYKNNNIPDDSKLKDREIGEVVKFANYLLKNNSTHDLDKEKINQVKTRTLEYANRLDKIKISSQNQINSAPVFHGSIGSGQNAQTKIVEERIPSNSANNNSIMVPSLRSLVSLPPPSPVIKPNRLKQGAMTPLPGITEEGRT